MKTDLRRMDRGTTKTSPEKLIGLVRRIYLKLTGGKTINDAAEEKTVAGIHIEIRKTLAAGEDSRRKVK